MSCVVPHSPAAALFYAQSSQKAAALFRLAERLDKGHLYEGQIRTLRALMSDERSVWYRFTDDLFKKCKPRAACGGLRRAFCSTPASRGAPRRARRNEGTGCRIPWAILMDPTSGLQPQLRRLWARAVRKQRQPLLRANGLHLPPGQAAGGPFLPLFGRGAARARKADLLRLCRAHGDCYFLSFTNGTLADEAFCDELARVGNLTLAFSIEGDEGVDGPAARPGSVPRRDRPDGPHARARCSSGTPPVTTAAIRITSARMRLSTT